MAIMSFVVLNVLLTFRSLADGVQQHFSPILFHIHLLLVRTKHIYSFLVILPLKSHLHLPKIQFYLSIKSRLPAMTLVLQPGSYLCCFFSWTLKFQHHREGAGVAATFQKVSSLKPFVRFYPLWNVFWAVPSKGISATQVTLSQCRHISQGKQNNPNREAKEASLIIWLPSQSFPLLTHPKVRAFTRPLFLSRSCILSFTSPPPVRRFVFRSQDVINVPPMWLLTSLALDFSLFRC